MFVRRPILTDIYIYIYSWKALLRKEEGRIYTRTCDSVTLVIEIK